MIIPTITKTTTSGIDFKDRKARLVAITGLPFPPYMDPRVQLNKKFLDENPQFGLKGQEWYKLQATSAINQAVGRVIRHKEDFGGIVLLDERFAHMKDALSLWLRSFFTVHNNFGQAAGSLTKFFNHLRGVVVPRPVAMEGDQKPSFASNVVGIQKRGSRFVSVEEGD